MAGLPHSPEGRNPGGNAPGGADPGGHAPDSALRVLVVEDDLIFQKIIQTYLQKSTTVLMSVVLAGSLADGLGLLASEKVDAVLLDLTLPDSEGLETLQRLHDHSPELPVIVLTGLDDDEVAAEAVRRGAQDFIVKGDLNASILSRSVRYAVERQKAEAALRDSESRFRAVVDDQTELVCRYRPDGTLTFVNSAFCRYFAGGGEELVGQSFFSLTELDKEGLGRFEPDLPTHSREQQLHEHETYAVWIQWTDRALFDPRGELVELQSVGRDTTEQKRLEQQLHHSQKMESLGRLAGGVAHDFNNLLTVITACCGLLDNERLAIGLPSHPQVVEIEQAAQRAAALTRQLLAVSRRHATQPVILDLNEVVHQTDALLARLIGERVEISLCLDPQLKPIKADRAQIEQILVNLVVNGRDAMIEGGELRVETANVDAHAPLGVLVVGEKVAETDHWVELLVSDTGTGIDEETQEKIFEPFFTTKEVGRGTGLGLSIVDSMVKQSRGQIFVVSELGRGTTFRIRFPACDEDFPETSEAASVVATAGAERKAVTILLVEDEALVRKVVTSLLEPQGYRVLAAATAEEALALVKENFKILDVILTDIVLPGRNGFELAEMVKKRHPHIRILFMSGYTDTAASDERFLEAGEHFLQKPFTPQELMSKLEVVLQP
jgi:two-component system cell cycle sensor histidine kinase/response regulator CckA